ncbi:MAG: hypothetical protein DRJ52_05415 [Thermoprotei archaeon]|nr:MAG: hypothetical protein DRJ52_05415 [Thermoprotei archaeon]RLE98911.1 MAG: hypothetical protein DRJ63_06780 [Thermoprotei archaeon]HDI74592.1 hypothetical protein [Thermoprotei archaeon]
MASNTFIEYLKTVAKKSDVVMERGKIKWFDREIPRHRAVDFLDMYYLDGKGDYVVLDRSTAYEIKERMEFLEREILKYKKRTMYLSIALLMMCVIVVIILVLW